MKEIREELTIMLFADKFNDSLMESEKGAMGLVVAILTKNNGSIRSDLIRMFNDFVNDLRDAGFKIIPKKTNSIILKGAQNVD